jgi:hypothetical protein
VRPYGVQVRHTARFRRAADPVPPLPNTPGPRRSTAWPAGAGLLLTGLLLLLGLLLTACGDPQVRGTAAAPADAPSAAPSTVPAATTPSAEPAPDPSGAPAPDEPIRLPWPVADPSAVAELQRSVDEGSEPWLLDPAEVAVSYVGAAHGWTQAVAQPRPDGTTVDVAEGGHRLTLSLRQPGRAGAGGIWVVTAESPG